MRDNDEKEQRHEQAHRQAMAEARRAEQRSRVLAYQELERLEDEDRDLADIERAAQRRRPADEREARPYRESMAQPGETYRGQVVTVDERYVHQEHDGGTVLHDRRAMGMTESQGLVGRDVEIEYPHGRVPLVRDGQSHDAAHAREHARSGPQHGHEASMGR